MVSVMTTLSMTDLLMRSTAAPDSTLARALSVRPLLWLGKISFSLYMVHVALLRVLTPVLQRLTHSKLDATGLLQGAAQVAGRLDARVQLDALEVAWILAAAAHLLGLLGVAHPLQDALAVLRQQIGQGGAEAAAAEYGNGLKLCHNTSEWGHARWRSAGIIRSRE